MARGRPRHQKGTIKALKSGGWLLEWYVYLTDPASSQTRRVHRTRTVGKMRKMDAQKILDEELGHVNAGLAVRPADGSYTFGEWMRTVYVPMRGANWRKATARTNQHYLDHHIYPALKHERLQAITKFNIQMLLNILAAQGYSYTVVYHVRDLIKAALSEAVEQDVIEKNVARKTYIPEIEARERHVLPERMYPRILSRLENPRDRAIFLIGSLCALRPSELFGLLWECFHGTHFVVINTAYRGSLQRKKIKKRPHHGNVSQRIVPIPNVVRLAVEEWQRHARNTAPTALIFPRTRARGRLDLAKPMYPDNWLRLTLYPITDALRIGFHPTFQVLRRSFSTHGQEEMRPKEMQVVLGHEDSRTTQEIYTQTVDAKVMQHVNAMANRLLGLEGPLASKDRQ